MDFPILSAILWSFNIVWYTVLFLALRRNWISRRCLKMANAWLQVMERCSEHASVALAFGDTDRFDREIAAHGRAYMRYAMYRRKTRRKIFQWR